MREVNDFLNIFDINAKENELKKASFKEYCNFINELETTMNILRSLPYQMGNMHILSNLKVIHQHFTNFRNWGENGK